MLKLTRKIFDVNLLYTFRAIMYSLASAMYFYGIQHALLTQGHCAVIRTTSLESAGSDKFRILSISHYYATTQSRQILKDAKHNYSIILDEQLMISFCDYFFD